ncbi:hypothetical protein [Anaerosoma tenue]|uniref:hypothetical protein n=1 Tax=Anaerosoma tenue TaxID=2933588 RepID=UPI002260CFF8|nr:hypothetical protein [Anaerosoma tenue]MCK8114821.1 hypothetical protein [Anaerosoma tenue]
MAELAAMTPEAAERLVARQPYDKRLTVSVIGKHGGFEQVPVCSAEEFLKVSQVLEPVFSVDALADWVSGNLGDPGLAAAIHEACEGVPAFKVAGPARVAMAARFEEATVVLAEADGTADAAGAELE